MKKATARTKSTGITDDHVPDREGWLSLEPIPLLFHHLEHHLSYDIGRKRRAWTRQALTKLALDIVLVALGIRRALLIDTFSPSIKDCLAIAEALQCFGVDRPGNVSNPFRVALKVNIAILYHDPTSQTFLVNRCQHMWTDRPTAVGSSEKSEKLWIDVRSHSGRLCIPRLVKPSLHLIELLKTLHGAVVVTDDSIPQSNCFQVEATALEWGGRDHEADVRRTTQERLIGTAMAGWLLEYGSVYCLDTPIDADIGYNTYSVRPIARTQLNDITTAESWTDMDAASMTNCLGSQPLYLFRVMLCSAAGRVELLAFSVPQIVLPTANATTNMRDTLQTTFQERLARLSPFSDTRLEQQLVQGSVQVEVSTVCLDRVAL